MGRKKIPTEIIRMRKRLEQFKKTGKAPPVIVDEPTSKGPQVCYSCHVRITQRNRGRHITDGLDICKPCDTY